MPDGVRMTIGSGSRLLLIQKRAPFQFCINTPLISPEEGATRDTSAAQWRQPVMMMTSLDDDTDDRPDHCPIGYY